MTPTVSMLDCRMALFKDSSRRSCLYPVSRRMVLKCVSERSTDLSTAGKRRGRTRTHRRPLGCRDEHPQIHPGVHSAPCSCRGLQKGPRYPLLPRRVRRYDQRRYTSSRGIHGAACRAECQKHGAFSDRQVRLPCDDLFCRHAAIQ